MWWAPQNTNEEAIASAISRISGAMLELSGQPNVIHAVGSTWAAPEDLRLLIVIDQSLAPPRRTTSIPKWFREEFAVWGEKTDPRIQKARLQYDLHRVDADIHRFLSKFDLPTNSIIMFSSPPQPLLRTRPHRLRGTALRRATPGFAVRVNDGIYGERHVITTAGHFVTPNVPCNVSVRRLEWPGTIREYRMGSIQQYCDPTSTPSVDIAIIELATPSPNIRFGPDSQIAVAKDVPDRSPAYLYGAFSGVKRGWVNGALQLTRSTDGRFWSNCWTVMEFDGGFARRGDSGGLVELQSGEILGHLVATIGIQRASGRYQCGLVQDAATILAFLNGNLLSGSAASIVEWDDLSPAPGVFSRWLDAMLD